VTDNLAPIWRKSTRSNGSGDCVEVATNLLDTTGRVLVRDSKNPDAAPLRFTEREWAAFIGGVADGEFNL
jgi:hypothetical protein